MLRGSHLRWAIWLAAVAAIALGVGAYSQWFRASIDVTTDPSGAEVRIDGRLAGRTPLQGEVMAPGMHRIELSHSHYVVHQRQLNLASGDHVELHVRLDPGLGKLVLYSNPRGAWVEVDGRRRNGKTPLMLVLPSGPHEVAMGMDERRAASEQVVVVADESRDVRLDLNIDPHGSLWLDVMPPGARVTLPNADVSYEPGLRLPMGEYPVRVSHPGYVPRELRLQVRYGDNHHRVALERAFADLAVRTDPPDSRVRIRYREMPDSRLAWHDYSPGVPVPVGEVEVRASAMGRRSAYRRLDLPPAGARVDLTLTPMTVEPGTRLRDTLQNAGRGPEMVVVPPGKFLMGSATGPPSERPPRRIVLTEPFAVSVTEVSAADYRRFALATGRRMDHRLADAPDDFPATHVTFADAVAYADWLSEESGNRYRLPSEAEWEYVARAGSATDYWFGENPADLCAHGNVADRSMRKIYQGFDTADCDDGFIQLAPVATFPPNGFGVHDVHGNVAEWVLECGLPGYDGAPEDGTPIDEGLNCPTHGVRGGSWNDAVTDARSSKRSVASSASGDRGIRLLREL